MSGEAARESADLDPVVRAAVEARARQSGLSLSDYLTRLIHAPAHGYPTQGSLRLNTSMGMPGSGNPQDVRSGAPCLGRLPALATIGSVSRWR